MQKSYETTQHSTGTIIPRRLYCGDTIGIVAPSNPVSILADKQNDHRKMNKQIAYGIRFLQDYGNYRVIMGDHVYSNETNERLILGKAQDLNRMFADGQINAVMFANGGDCAEKLLAYIDWNLIRNNPKITIGNGDATVLLNAINRETGLVTFHGNDLNSLGNAEIIHSVYDVKEFLRLSNGIRGEIPINLGNFMRVEQNNIIDMGIFIPRKTVREGKAQGKAVGGSLKSLLKLRGTYYWPDFDGSILFLESYKANGEMVKEQLGALKESGALEKLNGAVIGYNYTLQYENQSSEQMEEMLRKITHSYEFPILKINEFGQMCSQALIPIGIRVELDATNKKIKILEDFVR